VGVIETQTKPDQMKHKISISTHQFQFSHGKRPSGWGRWMFLVIDDSSGKEVGQIMVPHSMSLTDARRHAVADARRLFPEGAASGFLSLEVAP
jgi:hypothetical protein